MDDSELAHWLVLAHLPSLTAAQLRRLQEQAADPREILELPERTWRRVGIGAEALAGRRRWSRNRPGDPLSRRVDRARRALEQDSACVLVRGRPSYPALLAEIYDPPPLLYVAGDPRALAQRQFAVVGSRRCSPASARAAGEFAAQLVASGFSVCSGLALGIDGAAHRGALGAGGSTVAVIATGLDSCYPRRHRRLCEEIRERGAVVTEFNPGVPPRPERFPMRNRLISGLSVGVLVVEAGVRSGSLITARLALEQNREVFAMPHSIYDPGGSGCHQLLREGAGLAETAADLLAEVGSLCAVHAARQARPEPDTWLRPVWRVLGFDPLGIDELVSLGAGPVEVVTSALAPLEIDGYVEQHNGLYARKL
jgi:DNA processing protein